MTGAWGVFSLKNRKNLAWFARTASTVLLEKVRERKSVRVQTRTETAHTPHNAHEWERKKDISIYDCCRYFKSKGDVALITADKVLSITCEGDEHRKSRLMLDAFLNSCVFG